MRYTPQQWTFTGGAGNAYVFDVLSPDDSVRADPAVYVLANVHLKGHLAGFTAIPVAWGHTGDMREAAENIRDRDRVKEEYFSHICVLYCEMPSDERETLVQDLQQGSAGPATS